MGLVPRLNVVGNPSEARLLYVVDNDLSEVPPGEGSHVRHRRGKAVRRKRIMVVFSHSL